MDIHSTDASVYTSDEPVVLYLCSVLKMLSPQFVLYFLFFSLSRHCCGSQTLWSQCYSFFRQHGLMKCKLLLVLLKSSVAISCGLKWRQGRLNIADLWGEKYRHRSDVTLSWKTMVQKLNVEFYTSTACQLMGIQIVLLFHCLQSVLFNFCCMFWLLLKIF